MYTNISIKFPRHTGKTKLFSSLEMRENLLTTITQMLSAGKEKEHQKKQTKTQNRKLVTSLGEWKTTCQTLLRVKMMLL